MAVSWYRWNISPTPHCYNPEYVLLWSVLLIIRQIGGSTQITWIMTDNGVVRMSEQVSVSMPYGAAALTKRLSEADTRGSRDALKAEICRDLRNAIRDIEVTQELRDMAASPSGLSLYVSGGGFRGWGYLLLHQHKISPYPIPIINGFHCTISDFQDVETVQATAADGTSVFRISKRRAAQVPAVAFLISCLSEALPAVHSVHFAQGGVRDGCFFSMLDSSIRAQHPLVAGTRPGCAPSSKKLFQLMQSALPSPHRTHKVPRYVSGPLLEALAQSMYTCAGFAKDLRAASALRSTITGSFASIHGLSHEDRAALAIALCERWDGLGALSPIDREFHARLMRLLDPEVAWWCMFLGRVGALVAEVYPSGTVRETYVVLGARWVDDGKDKQKRSEISSSVLKLDVDLSEGMMDLIEAEGLQEAIDQIGKTGKKKNRSDGRGYQVDVNLLSKHVQH